MGADGDSDDDSSPDESFVALKRDYIVHMRHDDEEWLNGERMSGYISTRIVLVSARNEEEAEALASGYCRTGEEVMRAYTLTELRGAPQHL